MEYKKLRLFFSTRRVVVLSTILYSEKPVKNLNYGTVVNTYAAQSGGCRFESLWGFGFSLKGAYYEVGYCGKKTFLAGLECTLTSSCAITKLSK